MKTDKEFLNELSIETTNLISFEELSKWKSKEKCPHLSIIVDESLAEVKCQDCGKSLNPIWVIGNYARHQKSVYQELRNQLIRVKNIEKTLEKKQRTKCKHCGKFTPVNISMSDSKWMGFDVVK